LSNDAVEGRGEDHGQTKSMRWAGQWGNEIAKLEGWEDFYKLDYTQFDGGWGVRKLRVGE